MLICVSKTACECSSIIQGCLGILGYFVKPKPFFFFFHLSDFRDCKVIHSLNKHVLI